MRISNIDVRRAGDLLQARTDHYAKQRSAAADCASGCKGPTHIGIPVKKKLRMIQLACRVRSELVQCLTSGKSVK